MLIYSAFSEATALPDSFSWFVLMSINTLVRAPSARLAKIDADGFPLTSSTRESIADLIGGASRSWIWTRLAYQDIKLRYRGSVLGPFWVTLSNLVMIVSIGFIYSALFHVDTAIYVPYVMLGIIVWQLISGMILDGCQTFNDVKDIIQQVKLPFSIQAFRTVYRNLLIFAHNVVIIPLAMIVFDMRPNWHYFEAIPGLLILCFNGLWLSLFLGMASARFRDIPPIVASVVQVLFFLTPIFWPVSAVAPAMRHFLALNPFFAAVDVVRAPLLGVPPEPTSWPLVLGWTVVITLCGFGLFARFRQRIAYWI